jgi:hypothetical protein
VHPEKISLEQTCPDSQKYLRGLQDGNTILHFAADLPARGRQRHRHRRVSLTGS